LFPFLRYGRRVPSLHPPDPPLGDGVVELRGFRDTDADAITAMMDDADMARWTRTPWPYRRSDAVEWLATHPAMQERGESLQLAIVEADGGALVGSTGLRIREDRRGEIGYLVARWARRRGLAARALRLYARHAFDAIGLARVEVLVRPENAASLAVAERAGFTREGLLRSFFEARGERRDMVMLSLLPAELRDD
jgi:RimJ/RimL family protein N-acetyltransferase